MENLEESIRTLKEMFIERKPMIEVCDIFVVSFNFVDRRFTWTSWQDTEMSLTDYYKLNVLIEIDKGLFC